MSLSTNFNLRSVFIADDDADDRSFFAEALAEVNSDILLTEFEDGLQLINLLFQNDPILPDLIFLDINMPNYNGFECLEMIRGKQNKLTDIPIVILSTASDSATIQKAFDLGASNYAVKPSSFKEIKFFLNSIISFDWSSKISNPATFRLI